MRLNLVYFKYKHHAKSPQNPEKVPFKEVTSLSLRNYVVGEGSKTLENKCLYEMSLLFRCWKENHFNDSICANHMQKLDNCYKNYMKTAAESKKLKQIEIPSPSAKSYTSKQINYMLRMYPNV
ncbi:Coiled-coil-helix-coiled-coil-helix domain-containing protein 1 [Habropoda laboriosa]|uniref:Coiled-coil-helix-coiled-coil-helix domain-containing protein 1 n=1 Tax=Habropoda laboriosa TaxID=597456 RepID=A0A0L7QRK5_9HYME|nr:PREDICTED: coiled-coil-helix-coiled-coil-helix domain-containing protein 1-like [Habropoda laboriosa]KOC61258.1 Coiled-coil-helix-coiled-coil-helix domain-containing protein 1 [Habropoda laboriosa]